MDNIDKIITYILAIIAGVFFTKVVEKKDFDKTAEKDSKKKIDVENINIETSKNKISDIDQTIEDIQILKQNIKKEVGQESTSEFFKKRGF